MADFPELEPATRSYDLGAFPLTEQASLSAGVVRFRHGTTATNFSLQLEYVYISDAEATQIRNHFQGQGGSYRSFMLPPIIWKGHTFSGNIFPITTRWRYADTPEETHHEIGRYSMAIALVSDGTYEGAAMDPIAITIVTNGAGGGGSGFTATVTVSLVEGAATGS